MEKVLIIENNRMMRLFLSNYFSKDYEVISAKSPVEANVLLGKIDPPALIIADYYSQNSKERQELEVIRSKMLWQNVPMIILTDNDKSEQRIDALNMGVQDCVSKPFNPLELAVRVQNHVIAKESRMQYRPVA